MEASDALLVARLAAGDDHALAEVYDACAASVYAVALRVVREVSAAQDVVQEVFVQLWTGPERYDAAAAPLRTYLMVLARSRALDAVRADARRAARQERHHRLSADAPPPPPDDEVAAREAARLVREAVRALPDDQRRLVELAYFQGNSYREAAAALGVPEGTAKSRLRAALASLERLLDHTLLESS
ncbi:MAG: sigma-70 family RNA polymerase sigma factor [Kineosporiaceae bacterium]|nr:sigma-70 family RNA polymerase sigma factor [Kineosporiaceae bacterium]